MEPLLRVVNLRAYLRSTHGIVRAVDGVSFQVKAGETTALVGESGCGKSMTALSILRLVPNSLVAGEVIFAGDNLLGKTEREMRRIRGRDIAMILQDSMASLNPAFTVGSQLLEPIRLHQKLRGPAAVEQAIRALKLLRIPSPESRLSDYPHQLSGGMRQRVAGSIALSCGPRLLIADEPTTSLDVTIQNSYLKTLRDVQRESGVALIFITHDFGIVAAICQNVNVMYAGRIVERSSVTKLFRAPAHPYTKALLSCLPGRQTGWQRMAAIPGQPPDLAALPAGCYFAPRCSEAFDRCLTEYPREIAVDDDHVCSCWRAPC